MKGRIASLLEVGTGFHPELTGRENIYLNGAILGMTSAGDRPASSTRSSTFAEVEKFIDTPVKRYSSGMYVRLAFAVAAHLEPEILLVDEVLAVGDAEFQKKCLGKMGEVAHEGRTVLFVSHNMGAVRHLCSRCIMLEDGTIHFAGNTTDTIAQYEIGLLNGKQRTAETPGTHVIYSQLEGNSQKDFEITRVELLDTENNPKQTAYTWDTLRIRIHYRAKQRVKDGSVELKISDLFGSPLILLSTRPHGNVPMSIQLGDHFADCTIEGIPLSAGTFMIGCGLAIPTKEWLVWIENAGPLVIHDRDVYKSGMPPISSRSLLAIPHRWDV